MTRILLLLCVVLSGVANAECLYSTDDSKTVTCAYGDLQKLTTMVLDAEAQVEKLKLQLAGKDAQVMALQAALLAVPRPSATGRVKPTVAVALAVLGAFAVSTALVVDSLSTGARVGLGLSGAGAMVGAFILVF